MHSISFALSFTQEFLVGYSSQSQFLYWHLKEQLVFSIKLSKVFVHVSRCLIYKVHRPFAQPIWKVIRTSSGSRPPFRSNFYIIARIVQLVKHFFQFLSKSFVVWRPVSSGSAILSNNHPNVKHFFDFFAISLRTLPIVLPMAQYPNIWRLRGPAPPPAGPCPQDTPCSRAGNFR